MHADRSENGLLYKNLGGNRFKDVTEKVGLGPAGWSGDASFADLNGDGFPELYTLNMQGASHYWQNLHGKNFVDMTAEVFGNTSWGAMGLKFFDWDNDGRPDLFVTDMHSEMSEGASVPPESEERKSRMTWPQSFLRGARSSSSSQSGPSKAQFIFGNAFYQNLGHGKFEEISDRIGAENYWPWGLSVGDLNADGWQDVFIASSMKLACLLDPLTAAEARCRLRSPLVLSLVLGLCFASV